MFIATNTHLAQTLTTVRSLTHIIYIQALFHTLIHFNEQKFNFLKC